MEEKNKNQNQEEKEEPKINMQRVEALMSEITRQKITVDRFRFNMSEGDALDLLAAHYGSIVVCRYGTPQFDENTERNLKYLAKYLTREKPKFGVMFSGTCGNGKTTLMYALQSAINDLDRRGHFKFLSEYFTVGMRIVDAMDIVIMAKDLNSIRSLRDRSMLAIDDLGKEPTEVLDYGNVLSPVVDLMEYRYQHQLFTAVTTNLTPDEIRDKYGKRIADRFNEMLEVIVFDDISYRS